MGYYQQAHENTKLAGELKDKASCRNDIDILQSSLHYIPKRCIITRMKIKEAIFWREQEIHE